MVDVVVDGTGGHQAGPVAEVGEPAAQHRVEPVAHLGPRVVIAWNQQLADFGREPADALLGRARVQVPPTSLAVVVRSERVTASRVCLRARALRISNLCTRIVASGSMRCGRAMGVRCRHV
jgi:hypothetical protein